MFPPRKLLLYFTQIIYSNVIKGTLLCHLRQNIMPLLSTFSFSIFVSSTNLVHMLKKKKYSWLVVPSLLGCQFLKRRAFIVSTIFWWLEQCLTHRRYSYMLNKWNECKFTYFFVAFIFLNTEIKILLNHFNEIVWFYIFHMCLCLLIYPHPKEHDLY